MFFLFYDINRLLSFLRGAKIFECNINMIELDSNREWKQWGEIDPLFGVASWQNKNREGSNPWTNEDFYQLGELDWIDFKKHWEMYGVNNESCLEIGCGTGRITKQLACYFNEVHALDISDKMIDYAQKHITRPSVTFHLSKGTDIPIDNQSVHSCFSTHVFQHFDTLTVAKIYFKEIARVLKPNGTLMIHLPIYKWPSTSGGYSKIYGIYNRIRSIRAHIARVLMELKMVKPIMRGLWYPMDFFYEELPKLGFEDIEIFLFVTKSNNDPHPFILAKLRQ